MSEPQYPVDGTNASREARRGRIEGGDGGVPGGRDPGVHDRMQAWRTGAADDGGGRRAVGVAGFLVAGAILLIVLLALYYALSSRDGGADALEVRLPSPESPLPLPPETPRLPDPPDLPRPPV